MKSILDELKVECPFKSVMEEYTKHDGFTIYKKKLMHFRADHDGYRWYNTVWPYYGREATPEQAKEIDEFYNRLTARDAFRTLWYLKDYCRSHPEAAVSEERTDEFNFYYEGEHCLFWIRAITRVGDYNLYIHTFER